ncbi:MAG: hypothetical protein H7067_10325 [Burkholderiales bacterium]|nr:hypothetical protein [Opitutaceae bacterium]
MLPLPKKTGKKTEVDQATAWHPNFRNPEQLPDTKTVRTKFFVNIIVIAITSALLLSVALREFKLRALRTQLSDVEEQITASTKASGAAIAAYKLFQTEEKTFNEAYELVKDPFRFSDFVIRLGEVMPNGVKIRRIDYKGLGGGVVVAASVGGLDAKASSDVSAFVQLVQSDALLTRDFAVVTLTGLSRSAADGSMSFELSLTPKPTIKGGERK